MNKKKFGYIYITTNLINGKKYIGQHAFPTFDKKYKGSGTSLKKTFEKYGKENFSVEVIEWCYSQDELNEREIYWLKEYNAIESKDFYNSLRQLENTTRLSKNICVIDSESGARNIKNPFTVIRLCVDGRLRDLKNEYSTL